MRILVVSNYYPPHFVGGYELGCHAAMEVLKKRGHQIGVLTNTLGATSPASEESVWRALKLSDRTPDDRPQLLALERENQAAFDHAWQQHKPDIVYFWNLRDISISLVFRAAKRSPVSYFVSDGWLSRWRADPWFKSLKSWPVDWRGHVKLAMMRIVAAMSDLTLPSDDLPLSSVQFCSGFMKSATLKAGVETPDATVIHWGVDTSVFSPASNASSERTGRRLLYVGQLVAHKGVHTAIDALAILHRQGFDDVVLTLAGGTVVPEYEATIRAQADALGLRDAVEFTGMLSRSELPSIYRRHDILIMPSCWDEPFAITPLEAMASGLLVVGTMTGGSPELFTEGENALTFPAEDASFCASQIARAIAEPDLLKRLSEAGRRTVVAGFTLESMVDRIERQLHETVRRGRPN